MYFLRKITKIQVVTGVRDEATLEILNNPRNRLRSGNAGGMGMDFGALFRRG